MRFRILPGLNDMHHIVETKHYSNIWATYRKSILQAFFDVTGLEFQQKQITARVIGDRGSAGNIFLPMILPANCRTFESKCIVLVHELGHRLLGGNTLNGLALGYEKIDDEQSKEIIVLDHRVLSLFIYEVMNMALPVEVSNVYMKEKHMEFGDPHVEARIWAESMSKAQRAFVFKKIALHKRTRENWLDMEDFIYVGPKAYRATLDALKVKAQLQSIVV